MIDSNIQRMTRDFFSDLTSIRAPFPSSSPAGSLVKTAFEINPFLERILTDPYRTLDINVLSQSQLAIDSVFDYVREYIPRDLVNLFSNSPNVRELLSSLNTNLFGIVNEIESYLPSNLNIELLLRNTELGDLYNNIRPYVNALRFNNVTVENISHIVIIEAINYMSDMRRNFSSYQYYKLSDNTANIVTSNTADVKPDPFAQTALALSVIKGNAQTLLPVSSLLSNIAIENTSKALPFITNVSSSSFVVFTLTIASIKKEIAYNILENLNNSSYGAVIDNLKTIKMYLFSVTSKQILVVNTNYNNVIETSEDTIPKIIENMSHSLYLIGKNNFEIIRNIYNLNPTLVVSIGEYITNYGMGLLLPVSSHINNLTRGIIETLVTNINSTLTTNSKVEINEMLDYVETNSVNEYIDKYGEGNYTTLLNSITTYGMRVIRDICNLVFAINSNKVLTVCEHLNEIGYEIIEDLSSLTTVHSDKTIGTSIYNLNEIPSEDLARLITVIEELTAKNTYSLIVLINKLTLSNAEIFITNLTLYPYEDIYNAIPLLSQLTSNNLEDIVSNIKNTEIDSTFEYFNVTGNFFKYGVKKALEICAEVGNFRMVNKIFTTYNPMLTEKDKDNLVSLLLVNYSPSNDETIIGYEKASDSLIRLLNAVDEEWLYVTRRDELIYNNLLFIKSKTELLKLLNANPLTALCATLQLNNKYV